MRFPPLVLLLCASFASAQSFTAGVKGGGLLTEPAERIDQSRRYVVGVVGEVGLGGRFAVEGNALYSRFGSAFGSVRAHSAEFPVLGKFYFADRGAGLRPYASSGFSLRHLWLENRGRGVGQRVGQTELGVGAVAAGGVTVRAWRLKISPELRYTRWGGYNFPSTNLNQLQALVGITF
jgi:hypothetical protein